MCKCGAVQRGYFETIEYKLEDVGNDWNNTDTNFSLYAVIIQTVKCCDCQEKEVFYHYMKSHRVERDYYHE